MDVSCPGCGRRYPAARFAGGRTLDCACGRRVGARLGPRPEPRAAGPAARFAVDAMLGRLARWLRILGCDATWERDVADADLVRDALAEERWILTRDRALPDEWRVSRVYLVTAETPLEQLREVVAVFGLGPPFALFARCTRCNARLEPLPRERAAARVPPRVAASHQHFWRCPRCQRVYWAGSHVARMQATLERVLAPLEPET